MYCVYSTGYSKKFLAEPLAVNSNAILEIYSESDIEGT